MNNRDKLISIISDNGLERRDIAELVKVKLEIVDRWLASHESKHHEEVPDMAIELLEIKMALRKKKAKRK
jgi:hypothetical protein